MSYNGALDIEVPHDDTVVVERAVSQNTRVSVRALVEPARCEIEALAEARAPPRVRRRRPHDLPRYTRLTYKLYDESGRLPFVEQPEEFTADLVSWASALEP